MREKVRFTQAFKLFWTNYFNFKGRSRRSEYWFAMLWHLIFMIPTIIGYSFGIFCLILSEIFKSYGFVVLGVVILIFSVIYTLIYSLVTLIPNVAILSRRFHDRSMTMTLPIIFYVFTVILSAFNYIPDIDNSPVLIFMGIICLIYWIGSILILVLTCLDSKTESNKYGPSPKYNSNETNFHGDNANPVDK